jgi:hypothetical protein
MSDIKAEDATTETLPPTSDTPDLSDAELDSVSGGRPSADVVKKHDDFIL